MNPLDAFPTSEVHKVYLDVCASRDRFGVMIADELSRGNTPSEDRLVRFRETQIVAAAVGMFQDRTLENEQKP